jgi:hypothetical protein
MHGSRAKHNIPGPRPSALVDSSTIQYPNNSNGPSVAYVEVCRISRLVPGTSMRMVADCIYPGDVACIQAVCLTTWLDGCGAGLRNRNKTPLPFAFSDPWSPSSISMSDIQPEYAGILGESSATVSA